MTERTLKGLRADRGGLTQAEAAKALDMSPSAYNAVEQMLDDKRKLARLGKLYGVKIAVQITQ